MRSDPALEALVRAQTAARKAADRLDAAVLAYQRECRRETNELIARVGNPRYDQEWKL